ncbi:MAG TPA: PIN domain-containing protein [Candidatus Nanoarchaeia archaeon]|nr:PIN domain-containing protein [Candidatus Nanoarchaeia archaeon]
MIVFDTYAWIEYFRGSQQGKKSASFLEKEEVLTPIIVLVELSVKATKEGWDFGKHLEFIKSRSLIVGITEGIVKNCGTFYISMRKTYPQFGLIDAIIFLTGKERNAKVLTGDPHFKMLENVEFLE